MTQSTRGFNTSRTEGRPQHLDHLFDEKRTDPYATREKYAEPTVCGDCGAVYRHGRWTWEPAPAAAHKLACPACRRAHDNLPAGEVRFDGPFVEGHRAELLAIVRSVEAKEKAEHPLHRILGIAEPAGAVVVTTADLHLPRRIAEAVHRAHGGKLQLAYSDGDYSMRAHWHG